MTTSLSFSLASELWLGRKSQGQGGILGYSPARQKSPEPVGHLRKGEGQQVLLGHRVSSYGASHTPPSVHKGWHGSVESQRLCVTPFAPSVGPASGSAVPR